MYNEFESLVLCLLLHGLVLARKTGQSLSHSLIHLLTHTGLALYLFGDSFVRKLWVEIVTCHLELWLLLHGLVLAQMLV